jgi:spore maturation protein CgeB
MRILLAGNWHSTIYEEPLKRELQRIGMEVYEFKWWHYFGEYKKRDEGFFAALNKFISKVQERLLFGPSIARINHDLLKRIDNVDPDIVFLYRPTVVKRRTILRSKRSGRKFVSYHNDDPFSDNWINSRHYFRLLSMMDINYVYRPKNIVDVERVCGKKGVVLLPYPDCKYIQRCPASEKIFDIVFVGHYEADGRDDLLLKLALCADIKVGLFGTDWDRSPKWSLLQSRFGLIKPVRQADYSRVLNSSRIALCFFSKRNNDRYTRRTFEIPAAGTMLLSEYSAESAAILEPYKEAVYFSNERELIEAVSYYLAHGEERKRIADAGYEKVMKLHTIEMRVRQITDDLGFTAKQD